MNSNKRAGQTIHHDEFGEEYVLDEDGNKQTPMQSEIVDPSADFPVYDDSNGHCAFCGRLTCNGSCFK